MMTKEPFARPHNPSITCVLPVHNESENLPLVIVSLCQTLKPLSESFEIIVVDDGSDDETAATAVKLSRDYPVCLVQLSRNFGKEYAITAGIDHADADVVILMDADGQHPVSQLPIYLQHWREGYDMVFGVKSQRDEESWLKRKCVASFYALINRGSSIKIHPDAGDFRLFDKQVLEALRVFPERSRFMKGLYAWVGFRSLALPYTPDPRHAGKSTFTTRRLLQLAITGLTSFTDYPLRLSSFLGVFVSFFALIYGGYIAIRTFVFGADVPGWATLTVGMSFIGGLQLLSIGILGEYLSRVFTEVKRRPPYVVARRVGFKNK